MEAEDIPGRTKELPPAPPWCHFYTSSQTPQVLYFREDGGDTWHKIEATHALSGGKMLPVSNSEAERLGLEPVEVEVSRLLQPVDEIGMAYAAAELNRILSLINIELLIWLLMQARNERVAERVKAVERLKIAGSSVSPVLLQPWTVELPTTPAAPAAAKPKPRSAASFVYEAQAGEDGLITCRFEAGRFFDPPLQQRHPDGKQKAWRCRHERRISLETGHRVQGADRTLALRYAAIGTSYRILAGETLEFEVEVPLQGDAPFRRRVFYVVMACDPSGLKLARLPSVDQAEALRDAEMFWRMGGPL